MMFGDRRARRFLRRGLRACVLSALASERRNCGRRQRPAPRRQYRFSDRKQFRQHDARSDRADRQPAGRRQCCLRTAAVWVGALDNPWLTRGGHAGLHPLKLAAGSGVAAAKAVHMVRTGRSCRYNVKSRERWNTTAPVGVSCRSGEDSDPSRGAAPSNKAYPNAWRLILRSYLLLGEELTSAIQLQ